MEAALFFVFAVCLGVGAVVAGVEGRRRKRTRLLARELGLEYAVSYGAFQLRGTIDGASVVIEPHPSRGFELLVTVGGSAIPAKLQVLRRRLGAAKNAVVTGD